MSDKKTIGFVFIEGYADWEYGMLAASAVEYFGARAVALSPGAHPVHGISGFALAPERSIEPSVNGDLDAVAVIGSDGWAAEPAPEMAPLLTAIASSGGLVGGICAGTLALGRAGLLDGQPHTSNGRDWILGHLPGYRGAEFYRDVPHAVAGDRLVTAPGSAPGTFATAFLAALYPAKKAEIAEMTALLRREHAAVG